MTKKYLFLLIIAFILKTTISNAQESILDEVSNVQLEKLIATAKENYPRYKAFESRVDIAKSAVSKEKISWLDAFSFNYIYKPDNTLDIVNPTLFNGYQIGVSFNLSAVLQKPNNVKQAKGALLVAKYDQDEYNLTLEYEVKTRYYNYLYQKNIFQSQSKVFMDAQNANNDISARFQKGEVTLEIYNQSQISFSGYKQAKMAAELSWLTAKASLEELLGKKIEEVQ